MKKDKLISTTVYLEERQTKLLQQLKVATDRSVAEYIRLGIDMILDEHGFHKPRLSYSANSSRDDTQLLDGLIADFTLNDED